MLSFTSGLIRFFYFKFYFERKYSLPANYSQKSSTLSISNNCAVCGETC
ncbi:hypothetical protein NBG4_860003 [Candidatus Sulfobium mesophilum]|uniref:Uncharacterized protein n=1 Tax=Candidatus Sulfobium mesophilum TaxID=2016548 RepID=A0A2U3QKS7_9BACT|nr:hypothetical protein NBG4_860003 [Candidatus Sulfobium mesophilum]